MIEAGFRADESMTPEVVPDTGTHIKQEVVGTVIAGAEGKARVCGLKAVEARGLPPDATKQIGSHLFVETRLVNPIEVKKDGAIRLAEIAEISNGSPGGIKAGANSPFEDHVRADVGIQPAAFRASEAPGRSWATGSSPGGHHGSEAEHSISLLRRRKIGQRKKNRNNNKEGELSQVKPPVIMAAGA